MSQVSRDPFLTLQLREPTMQKLREITKKYWAPEMKETLNSLSYCTYCSKPKYKILNLATLNHSNWHAKTNVKILTIRASTSLRKITEIKEHIRVDEILQVW